MPDIKKTVGLLMVAPLFAILVGCAASPDSQDVTDAIKRTANAQGGVCIGQTFPWLLKKRAYGVATVHSVDPVTHDATVEVLSHRPSSMFSLISDGDSSYDGSVVISGLNVKSQGCQIPTP